MHELFRLLRYALAHKAKLCLSILAMLLMALLSAPGLWLQRITTKTPSTDQTEIAIVALQGAMELEKTQGGELVIA